MGKKRRKHDNYKLWTHLPTKALGYDDVKFDSFLFKKKMRSIYIVN